KEIIDFNERNKQKEMPYFAQDLFIKAEAKGPLSSKEYRDALAKNRKMTREEGIDAVMDKFQLDALIAPTAGPAWPNDYVNGDHGLGNGSQLPAVSGYPNINVPVGYVFGLPFGMSIFGKAYSEPKLIKIAYAFEQATKFRKVPQFLPSLRIYL
ncbi:MAG TPA: amidase family protein, partial [Terriglobales bacterium]